MDKEINKYFTHVARDQQKTGVVVFGGYGWMNSCAVLKMFRFSPVVQESRKEKESEK